MEDYNGYETVKERLILAGISELQKHSVEDLSLRKVASLCNVSCAAPYKHFKNKQEFISEIIVYINQQWSKLRRQVIEVYPNDCKTQIVEVCIAYIKFCMANPSFRNIIVMKTDDSNKDEVQQNFSFSDDDLIRKYYSDKTKTEEEIQKKIFVIYSLVYGVTYMLDKGNIKNTKENIDKIRIILNEELD